MYTIAEIGLNHNGCIDIARKIICIAHAAGFDAVKFQKRNPDVSVPDKKKNEIRNTPWGKMSYLEYRKKIEFGYDEYCQIQYFCKLLGIEWFSSVWDIESAQFMMNFVDTIKIPSACLTNNKLLLFCKSNFKRRILSTGMSTERQIEHAIEIFDPQVVLHCNASYPCEPQNLRLGYIQFLKNKYPQKTIGYSGHEYGIETTYAAVMAGADVIERHVTLSHSMWGSDQISSVEPEGMFKMIRGIENCILARSGNTERFVFPEEEKKMKDLKHDCL